jgi:hypothetical protein
MIIIFIGLLITSLIIYLLVIKPQTTKQTTSSLVSTSSSIIPEKNIMENGNFENIILGKEKIVCNNTNQSTVPSTTTLTSAFTLNNTEINAYTDINGNKKAGLLVKYNGSISKGSYDRLNTCKSLFLYRVGYDYKLVCYLDKYEPDLSAVIQTSTSGATKSGVTESSTPLSYNIRISFNAFNTTSATTTSVNEIIIKSQIVTGTNLPSSITLTISAKEIEPYVNTSKFIKIEQYYPNATSTSSPISQNAQFLVTKTELFEIPIMPILPKPINEILINSYFNNYPLNKFDKLYYFPNNNCELVKYINGAGTLTTGVLVKSGGELYQGRTNSNSFEYLGITKLNNKYTLSIKIDEYITPGASTTQSGIFSGDIHLLNASNDRSSDISGVGNTTRNLVTRFDKSDTYTITFNTTVANLNPILIRVRMLPENTATKFKPFVVASISLTDDGPSPVTTAARTNAAGTTRV